VSVFRWSEKKLGAAKLIADDSLTDVEIGLRVGVSDRQLRRWKHVPEFQARVEEHCDAYRARIEKEARDYWKREFEQLGRASEDQDYWKRRLEQLGRASENVRKLR
jgi:hypothetical protein